MTKPQTPNTSTGKAEFLVREKIRGFDLSFKSTWGLFSYQKIDAGTSLLAEAVEVRLGSNCLDLGCGYGVLGIVIAKLGAGQVWMTDRDVVAVEYTNKNCILNNINNFKVVTGNGFESVDDEKFDLIVSNLPTHTANEMIKWLLTDAKNHLTEGGEIWIVTVNTLKPFAERELFKVFGNYELVTKNSTHAVARSRRTG